MYTNCVIFVYKMLSSNTHTHTSSSIIWTIYYDKCQWHEMTQEKAIVSNNISLHPYINTETSCYIDFVTFT